MFENITQFFKRLKKSEKEETKSTAKERLHLVLAQDRANISADFLEMMKQEILDVIKKYIDIDEKAIDVRLTNKEGEDGSVGAPTLYANIPIITIKNEARKLEGKIQKNKDESNEIKNDVKVSDQIKENDSDQEASDEKEIENNKQKENIKEQERNKKKVSKNKGKKIHKESCKNEISSQQEKSKIDNLNEVDNEKKNS